LSIFNWIKSYISLEYLLGTIFTFYEYYWSTNIISQRCKSNDYLLFPLKLNLSFSIQAKLNQCRQLLEQYESKTLPAGVTDKQLWEAQKTVQVRLFFCIVFFYINRYESGHRLLFIPIQDKKFLCRFEWQVRFVWNAATFYLQ